MEKHMDCKLLTNTSCNDGRWKIVPQKIRHKSWSISVSYEWVDLSFTRLFPEDIYLRN
jgi:hypothetical protein